MTFLIAKLKGQHFQTTKPLKLLARGLHYWTQFTKNLFQVYDIQCYYKMSSGTNYSQLGKTE